MQNQPGENQQCQLVCEENTGQLKLRGYFGDQNQDIYRKESKKKLEIGSKMSQSKGSAFNSIKFLYFNLVLLYITATEGRQNICKWTGKAAVLLCLFHLKSSQFKKWLKDGRSLMKRPKILKKRNQSGHPNGQCQTQQLSGWYFCQILFMCIKVKAVSLYAAISETS